MNFTSDRDTVSSYEKYEKVKESGRWFIRSRTRRHEPEHGPFAEFWAEELVRNFHRAFTEGYNQRCHEENEFLKKRL